jgi:hypothetical protein
MKGIDDDRMNVWTLSVMSGQVRMVGREFGVVGSIAE